MRAKFNKAKISGIQVCIPSLCVDIDECLDELFDGNTKTLQRTKKILGLQKRYISTSEISVTDLAYIASSKLLSSLKVDKDSINTLIFVTQTPDFFMPSCANYLHGKLNLNINTIAFDINQACAGYLYGLFLAYSFIENGNANKILLICGDTLTKTINKQDLKNAPIFGDGVSATLIENGESESFFDLHSLGKGFDRLIIPQGAFADIYTKEVNNSDLFCVDNTRSLENLYMDGTEIFNQALKLEVESTKKILDFACKSYEDVDYFLFHQSNKFLVESIASELNIVNEKVPNFLMEKYANLSGCSLPALLCELNQNNFNATLSAFGAGYSWGSAYLKFDKDLKTYPITFYKGEKNDKK